MDRWGIPFDVRSREEGCRAEARRYVKGKSAGATGCGSKIRYDGYAICGYLGGSRIFTFKWFKAHEPTLKNEGWGTRKTESRCLAPECGARDNSVGGKGDGGILRYAQNETLRPGGGWISREIIRDRKTRLAPAGSAGAQKARCAENGSKKR